MKKLGVAMSGGGAKALCYLGFLNRLEEAAIVPQYVSAHSGAAILLCFVESGLSPQEIVKAWSTFSYWRFTSIPPFINGGLMSAERYIRYVRHYTSGKDIAQMRQDTIIYTSDLTDFERPLRISNTSGDLAKIAVISSLIPPLFPLYREGGKLLGDGGFTSTYSAQSLRARGAEVVLGLFPSGLRFTPLPFRRLIGDQVRVSRSLMSQLRRYELAEQPVDLEVDFESVSIGLNDYRRAEAMYMAGQEKAAAILPQLQSLLA